MTARETQTATARRDTGIHLVPLRSGDVHAVEQVLAGLSATSRFLRFHTALSRIPARYLSQLATVTPGDRYVALATAETTPIGHAEWTRDPHRADIAEAAVAVADAWQGRGIGRALAGHVAATAHAAGIRQFRCYTLGENLIARRFLLGRGAVVSRADSSEFLVPVTGMLQVSPVGEDQNRRIAAA